MAITFVTASFAAQDYASASGARALAYAQNVASGSLLVMGLYTWGTAGTTVTVSDSLNGAWTQAGGYHANPVPANIMSIWYFQGSAAGACTVTVTPSTTAAIDMMLHEYTGCATTNVLRNTVETADGLDTHPLSGTCTASAGDLVFAMFGQPSTATSSMTVAAPFTLRANIPGNVVVGAGSADDVNAGGNEGATWTVNTTVRWTGSAASFKPGSAPPAPQPPTRTMLIWPEPMLHEDW